MQNILNKYNINIINQNGILLIEAKSVEKLLKLTNIRTSIVSFVQDEKCLLDRKDNIGRIQKTICLTEKGFFKLICLSRKPIAVEIAHELGLYVKHKYVPAEISFINNIQSAFYGEKMVCQYRVDTFRIDLYFPDYNLAIEFDEIEHKFKTKKIKLDKTTYTIKLIVLLLE